MQNILLQLLAVIEKLGSAIISLIAVYFGWRLGYYSERRRRELEILEKKIEALRELRELVDNIPRDIKAEQLAEREDETFRDVGSQSAFILTGHKEFR